MFSIIVNPPAVFTIPLFEINNQPLNCPYSFSTTSNPLFIYDIVNNTQIPIPCHSENDIVTVWNNYNSAYGTLSIGPNSCEYILTTTLETGIPTQIDCELSLIFKMVSNCIPDFPGVARLELSLITNPSLAIQLNNKISPICNSLQDVADWINSIQLTIPNTLQATIFGGQIYLSQSALNIAEAWYIECQLFKCFSLSVNNCIDSNGNFIAPFTKVTSIAINGTGLGLGDILNVDDLIAGLLTVQEINAIDNQSTATNLNLIISTVDPGPSSISIFDTTNNSHFATIIGSNDDVPCATQYNRIYQCWFDSDSTTGDFEPDWLGPSEGFVGIELNGTYYPFSTNAYNNSIFEAEMNALNIGYVSNTWAFITDGAFWVMFDQFYTDVKLYVAGYTYPDQDGYYEMYDNGQPPMPSLTPCI